MNQRGFTLVELMVVICISGILLVIATMNWNQMQVKSGIETEIKTMHADLMEVRQQALYTKQKRKVVISGQSYKAYPGNVTTVTPLVSKQLRFPVLWSGSGDLELTIDTQGLITATGSTAEENFICVAPTGSLTQLNSAAVDSLVLSAAQINLGLRTGGTCNSADIQKK